MSAPAVGGLDADTQADAPIELVVGPTRWRLSATVTRLAVTAALFLFVGLAFGQVFALAIALPAVLVLALAGVGDASVALTGSLTVDPLQCTEGELVTAVVTLASSADLDAVAVRLVLPADVEPLDRSVVVTNLTADQPLQVSMRMRARSWGRHSIGPVQVDARGRHLLRALVTRPVPATAIRILPAGERFAAQGALPQTAALVGAHLGRRRGDGVDFDGIRDYIAGDRLRRVNWRATGRSGQLQVNVGRPQHNATVAVALDLASNPRGAAGTSLDIGVRAALGIAEHFLGQGDRVGMFPLPWWGAGIPAASGRRQLDRLQEWLLAVRVVRGDLPATPPPLPPRLSTDALVVVITPLLADIVVAEVARLSRAGRPLVIIDTLPDDALPPATRPARDLARRIWLLEREQLISRLTEAGCPTVRWVGTGSLDHALRDLARLATRPRLVIR